MITQYSNGVKRLLIVIFAGLMLAVGLNFFLLPGNIFGAGLNGIAQLISAIVKKTVGWRVDTGYFIFLLNIPVVILGLLKVGKSFTFYSILTVITTTVLTITLPVEHLTTDPLMNALFGGLITGVGVGCSLKYGFSTGGMDIVAVFLNMTTGRSVGFLMLLTNMIIILTAGFYFSWQSALYTIISNYALTRVVDSIHTSHQKLTAFVVTTKAAQILPAIQQTLVRGVTVLPSKGAYTGRDSQTLMTVLTRYELYRFKQLIKQEDPAAFINFVNTADVAGNFANAVQQDKIKAGYK
ncbi:YitT family protein [Liquorilactobacillus oeni]|uniref:DUF2179 domain-containing protein n=1 Tax=Liquorilactobacillus oeni DSM 19972 TaxID=1423777 RepID=A0A0R1MIG0_9LACO|nr:YitT family protein [Liquorilactobacillus oeni]KRL04211.1 hypothetical protein FD46_GL001331 [Liquorilactobacillus oeni DSM 19972]